MVTDDLVMNDLVTDELVTMKLAPSAALLTTSIVLASSMVSASLSFHSHCSFHLRDPLDHLQAMGMMSSTTLISSMCFISAHEAHEAGQEVGGPVVHDHPHDHTHHPEPDWM